MTWTCLCCDPDPGGTLPAGENVGDILFWDGTAWVPNADGVPGIGDTLVWDGANWILAPQGAGGGGLPAGQFDNDILVYNLGTGKWERDFTFPTSTQTTWSVDTGAGSDSNVGTAASPLATYAELFRRWSTLIVDASVATIAVTFIGDPPAGTPLILDGATFLGPTVVTVSGTMTQTDNGSITAAFVTWDGTVAGADGRRALLTDAAQDFTASVLRRIRMTSGAANNAVTNIMSLGGGVTLANVGQFTSATATQTPANGDTYVIETHDVTFAGYQIHSNGNGTFIIKDLEFVATTTTRCSASVKGDSLACVFFGCRFHASAGSIQLQDKARFSGCSTESSVVFTGSPNILNCCSFNFVQVNAAQANSQAWAFDGGGVRNAVLFCGNYTYLEAVGGSGNFALAFYGAINGTGVALLTIEDFAQVVHSTAASNFIGATGNTTTDALIVRNGCGLSYITKPKATGVAPGTDVVISGAAAIAWAAVPALAAAPNNGFVNVRQ